MHALVTSLLLAARDLADRRVLAILAKSIGISLLAFALLAIAGWWALDWLLAMAGLDERLVEGADGWRNVLSGLLVLAGLLMVWRIVALGVIQFFADDVVIAVEQRCYPEQAVLARNLPLRGQARMALAAAGRAIVGHLLAVPLALLLLFTGIGPALVFWLLNALLLGRELHEMVWARHNHCDSTARPPGRLARISLGAVVAVMLTVPFLHFLAPVFGAAAATHLLHRQPTGHGASPAVLRKDCE